MPTLDAEVVIDAAALRYQPHERLRLMRVELVEDEDPGAVRVGVDGAGHVSGEVLLVSRGPDAGEDDLACGHVEVRDKAERPVTRSTCLREIVSTMPRLMTSSASSCGVQCVTGRSLSSGGSQATAMICVSCSAVKVGGPPWRGSSARSSWSNLARSLSLAPSCSAVARRCSPLAQRVRHRRTRWRSTPRRRPCSSLLSPAADIRTMALRSTSRAGVSALFLRHRSRMARCRPETAIACALATRSASSVRSQQHDPLGSASQHRIGIPARVH